MRQLLEDYCETLLTVKENLSTIPRQIDEMPNTDYRLLSSAKSDIEYNIEWLSTGRCPTRRRGVERLSYYQRTRPYDPQDQEFLKYTARANKIKCRRLSDDELKLLDSFMSLLSPREKEVYTMVKAFGYSYEYVADVLGVSKSCVQQYMRRATQKIDNALNNELQLMMFG